MNSEPNVLDCLMSGGLASMSLGDDLHSQFCSTIMLLTMVTSLNHNGYLTLGAVDTHDLFVAPKDLQNLTMGVLASVLVQDHEVIAIMATATESLQVITIQDWNDVENTDSDTAFKSFTALTNPWKDLTSPADYISIPLQGSCWDAVKDERWEVLRLNE
jgi:hypothetical protein